MGVCGSDYFHDDLGSDYDYLVVVLDGGFSVEFLFEFNLLLRIMLFFFLKSYIFVPYSSRCG